MGLNRVGKLLCFLVRERFEVPKNLVELPVSNEKVKPEFCSVTLISGTKLEIRTWDESYHDGDVYNENIIIREASSRELAVIEELLTKKALKAIKRSEKQAKKLKKLELRKAKLEYALSDLELFEDLA